MSIATFETSTVITAETEILKLPSEVFLSSVAFVAMDSVVINSFFNTLQFDGMAIVRVRVTAGVSFGLNQLKKELVELGDIQYERPPSSFMGILYLCKIFVELGSAEPILGSVLVWTILYPQIRSRSTHSHLGATPTAPPQFAR